MITRIIYILPFFLLIFQPNLTTAQCDPSEYKLIMKLAKEDLEVRNYQRAIDRFLDARDVCPGKKEEVDKWIAISFQRIEGEKNLADSLGKSFARTNLIMKEMLQKERLEDLNEIKRGHLPDLYVLAIGINEYENLPASLTGSVNDADNILQSWGANNPLFGQIHNYRLINEEATKENIANRIKWIAQESGPNDLVYIHFSGHSSATANKQGGFVAHDWKRNSDGTDSNVILGEDLFSWLFLEDAFVMLFLDFDYSYECLQPFEVARESDDPDEFLHKVFGFGSKELTFEKASYGFLSYASSRVIKSLNLDLDQNGVLYLDEFYQGMLETISSSQLDGTEKNAAIMSNFRAVIPATITNIPIRQFVPEFQLPKTERPITQSPKP